MCVHLYELILSLFHGTELLYNILDDIIQVPIEVGQFIQPIPIGD